jgi:hypothetical protein
MNTYLQTTQTEIHRQALLHDAEQARLAQQTPSANLLDNALHFAGEQLIALGERLTAHAAHDTEEIRVVPQG